MRILKTLFICLIITLVGVLVFWFTDLRVIGLGVLAYYRGSYALKNHDPKTAESYFQEALKGYPDRASVYLQLGDIANDLHHTRAAQHHFQQALNLNPKSKEALSRLGKAEQELGNHRIALKLYQDALEIDPGDTSLRTHVADLYLDVAKTSNKMVDFAKAEAAFKLLLEKNKDDDIARYRLAESVFAQGQYEEALALYCDLAQKYPENPETFYSLAVAFARNQAYPEAHRYMMNAAELMDAQDPDIAREWAQQALQFRQNSTDTLQENTDRITHCLTRLKDRTTEAEESTRTSK